MAERKRRSASAAGSAAEPRGRSGVRARDRRLPPRTRRSSAGSRRNTLEAYGARSRALRASFSRAERVAAPRRARARARERLRRARSRRDGLGARSRGRAARRGAALCAATCVRRAAARAIRARASPHRACRDTLPRVLRPDETRRADRSGGAGRRARRCATAPCSRCSTARACASASWSRCRSRRSTGARAVRVLGQGPPRALVRCRARRARRSRRARRLARGSGGLRRRWRRARARTPRRDDAVFLTAPRRAR